MTTQKYPQGHFMSLGISIGLPIGVALGLAMGNIAIGIAIGAAIGIAVGASLEQKNKDKIRPLTREEIRKRRIALGITAGIGIIMFLIILALYLIR